MEISNLYAKSTPEPILSTPFFVVFVLLLPSFLIFVDSDFGIKVLFCILFQKQCFIRFVGPCYRLSPNLSHGRRASQSTLAPICLSTQPPRLIRLRNPRFEYKSCVLFNDRENWTVSSTLIESQTNVVVHDRLECSEVPGASLR